VYCCPKIYSWSDFFMHLVTSPYPFTAQLKRMIRSLPILILLFSCAVTALPQKKKVKTSVVNFTIQPLAPGVWAAIHNDQYGRAICNAGIVDLGDKTLVFDPFMTPQAAQELKEAAEQLTGRPVTIVVNSHYHNDHIRGNQVFAPIATIISTNYTRNKIAEVEPGEQAWERKHAPGLLKATRQIYNTATGLEKEELPLWIGYYEGMMESMDDLKITLPDIVFDDSLWILGSERDVKLMEFKNGHTASDIVLCVPSERVAFLGDLLFVQRHPWLCDGELASWQTNLEKLYADKFIQKYVPGHGAVCEKQGVKDLYNYLATMQHLVESAGEDSLKISTLIQNIPPQYSKWYFGRFYQANMKHLFSSRRKEVVPQ
jgi:cyclase